MQCPKCSFNVQAAPDAICGECSYKFGLNPSESHRLTDAHLLSLVSQASVGGTRYFTQNQLHYFYCAERMPNNGYWPLTGIVGGALSYMALNLEGAVMGGISAAALTYLATKSWRPPPRSVLDNVHQQMSDAGHPLKHFIAKPLFEFRDEGKYTGHLPLASEIDRVIVVDRDILVDLLVLNGLPKRTNSLIISHTGYPNYVLPIVEEMLAKRQALSLYLLHDSTESRHAMKRSLADSNVLSTENHRIFNLGLDPEQVRYLKRLAPLQPARSNYRVPLDAIPYPYLEAAIIYALNNKTPFLTALAASQFVDRA